VTVSIYRTPRGFADLIMVSDGDELTGLWFEGARNAPELRPGGAGALVGYGGGLRNKIALLRLEGALPSLSPTARRREGLLRPRPGAREGTF